MAPQLIFGTASFGMDLTEFQEAGSVKHILETVRNLGVSRLDTAARYPPLNPGKSEQLLGEARELATSFPIDTKIFTNTQTDGSGDLSREAVTRSVEASLERLKRSEGVNVLYAHRPDPTTPLAEQIQAFNDQINAGHCKSWGISNFPPELVKEILVLCEKNGWRKPSHYQGAYNLANRSSESTLFPILREGGISFVAFQALAAGYLTGKLVNKDHSETRLGDDNPLSQGVKRLIGADTLETPMKRFDTTVRGEGLLPVEVAIRWLVYHSALEDQDAVILGASKSSQIKETVGMIQNGPLSPDLVKVADEMWGAIQKS